ncbi:MAG TPA: helix-turn-helix domain-containing protein [Acidimicrobiales bacterium]|nr:helix-turn-helix domain-containing protein [Acidimicrobiales bacterium]
MPRSADTTKARLITAAEQLFAARGIDAVSLREINRAAGSKNAIAVQYHFDDRDGVLKAILAKHRPDVESRRHAMLDQYEADGDPDLRALSAALVRPSAAKLADDDGGPEYLQISAYLLNRPEAAREAEGPVDRRDSIQRWRLMVEPLLEEEATRLHRRFTAIRFSAIELGRRAATAPHTDDRLFVSHLVDLVAAILGAPVSEETVRLADARDARRRGPRPKRR